MNTTELELATLKALGAAMAVNPDAGRADLQDSGLSSRDFTNAERSALFDAMALRIRDGRALDVVAMAHSLGTRVARDLLIAVLTSGDYGVFPERAGQLRDATSRREMVNALKTALVLAQDERISLRDAAREAARAAELASSTRSAARLASSDLIALCDRLEQVQLGKFDPVLPTGVHPLDALIGGLQTTLTVIGALPGIGKSALLASMVRNLSRRGVTVGVFSLEDHGEWLARRMLSEASAVPLFVLGNRRLTSGQLDRVLEAASRVGNETNRVMVDDRQGITASDIVDSAREMITKHGAKAIFVDHLGEIRLQRSDRHDLDIAQALSELRALANLHKVPVVVLCHVKRRDGLGKNTEPTLTDFAFSAGVERMARVALALSRDAETDNLVVSVLKQTGGQADLSVELPFRGPAGMVGNGEPSREADDHYARQEAQMREWDTNAP